MISFFTRFRTRKRSDKSPSTDTAATQETGENIGNLNAPVTPSLQPPSPAIHLDNKIIPDINAFLSSTEFDNDDRKSRKPSEEHVGGMRILKPNRPRVDVKDLAISETDKTGVDHTVETQEAPSSLPASLKGWSTFGRERRNIMPDLREFGRRTRHASSRSRRVERDENRNAEAPKTKKRTASNADSQRSTAPSSFIPLSSRPTTGISTFSTTSKPPSIQSSVRGSNVQDSSSPDPSTASHSTSPITMPSTSVTSPATFGHLTPDNAIQPTPLTTPPVVFPSISASLENELQLEKEDEPTQTPSRSFRNRQGGVMASTALSFPPLTSTFGKAFRTRTQSDRPQASTVFSSSSFDFSSSQDGHSRSHSRTRSQSRIRARSRSRNKDHSRRVSAEWSAQQAVAGVVADSSSSQSFGWPAEVSREMVRMALQIGGFEYDNHHQSVVLKAKELLRDGKAEPIVPDAGRSHGMASTSRQSSLNVTRPEQGSSLPFSSSSLSTTASAVGSYGQSTTNAPETHSTRRVTTVHGRALTEQSHDQDDKTHEDDVAVRSGRFDVEEVAHTKADEKGRMISHTRRDSDGEVRWEANPVQEYLSGDEDDFEKSALRPSTPSRPGGASSTALQSSTGSSLLKPPSVSVIAPTPEPSPGHHRKDDEDDDGRYLPESVDLSTPKSSKGKRKAEDSEDGSPPGSKSEAPKKSSFATPMDRGPRTSNASHAPSSYQSTKSRKRVRLSSPLPSPSHSRPSTAANTSSTRSTPPSHHRTPSLPIRSQSVSHQSTVRSTSGMSSSSAHAGRSQTPGKRRSMTPSHAPSVAASSAPSIPFTAIVSPRAPTVDRSSMYHMHDPRKPPPKKPVGWTLRFPSNDDRGSPPAAWCFWFGFLLPFLWLFASFLPIPKTRLLDSEKSIPFDDPQVEREARSWRLRCRVATVLFFFTYVPVIVLLAIFVPRS